MDITTVSKVETCPIVATLVIDMYSRKCKCNGELAWPNPTAGQGNIIKHTNRQLQKDGYHITNQGCLNWKCRGPVHIHMCLSLPRHGRPPSNYPYSNSIQGQSSSYDGSSGQESIVMLWLINKKLACPHPTRPTLICFSFILYSHVHIVLWVLPEGWRGCGRVLMLDRGHRDILLASSSSRCLLSLHSSGRWRGTSRTHLQRRPEPYNPAFKVCLVRIQVPLCTLQRINNANYRDPTLEIGDSAL